MVGRDTHRLYKVPQYIPLGTSITAASVGSMEPQEIAAKGLTKALSDRQVQSGIGTGAHGYSVTLSGVHPPATVHFGYGNMREIFVQLVFDGRRPVTLNTADPEEIADLVIAKIAGEGGSSPSPN